MTDLGSAQQGGRTLPTIGRYKLVREIGRGGMAVVYLARQTDLDRDVALKELAALHSVDPARVERFLRESRLAGSLNQPNVVTVHEFFEHEGTGYIAMEYFERGSLRPYVRRLTLAQTVGVLEGLLAGLARAHRRAIVHRDLKPENVMVTTDGGVKITDFGIAKALETLGGDFVTATGVTVGTPAYMAPEQARGEEVGSWTDLYAVGVIAYEMLSGALPFEQTDQPLATMLQHVSEPIRPLRSIRPDVDPALAGWVERLLTKDTRKRPDDARAAWEELEEIAIRLLGPRWRRDGRLVEEALEPSPKRAFPPQPRSRLRRIRAMGLVAAVVVGGTLAGVELTGGQSLRPDLAPPALDQASLAVAGNELYLADPRGQVVDLDATSLREKHRTPDAERPRAVATSQGLTYVSDDRSLKAFRAGKLVRTNRLRGFVATAGGEDAPLVVATTDRICEVGARGALGPCSPIGFPAVALGASTTGVIFTADRRGAVAVFTPRNGRLVYSGTVSQALSGPHGKVLSSRGRLYVPVERGIAVVDPLALKVLRVIHLPVTPAAIWVGRFSGQLFAALYGADRIALVATTIADATPRLLSGFDRPVAVWGTAAVAYVYDAGDRTICRLDALTGQRLGCRAVPHA